MPEFQAPGVYVEEVSFRTKTIEPVGTTLTGFVGPCRSGPVAGVPPLLTSLGDFERRYGDGAPLHFGAQTLSNDLWHAVRVFFLEGGQALHVSRVFRAGAADDGCARLSLGADGAVQLRARHPGAAGNLGLRFSFRLGASLLQAQARPDGRLQPLLAPQADGALVWLRTARVPQPPGPLAARNVEALPLYQARRDASGNWWLQGARAALRLDDFAPDLMAGSRDVACALSVSVDVLAADGTVLGQWVGLPLQGMLEAFGAETAVDPPPPIVMTTTGAAGEAAGLDLLRALLPPLAVTPAAWAAAGQDELAALAAQLAGGVTARFTLAGGHDGVLPEVADYVGHAGADGPTGLLPFEALADIALVAAPGGGSRAGAPARDAAGIARALIDHAERMRYRLALVDVPQGLDVGAVRRFRAGLDSRRAALYHPWVLVADPHSGQALQLPPSGFVAGLCVTADDLARGWLVAEVGVALLRPAEFLVFRIQQQAAAGAA
ncbi:hypothetical protein [Roseateles sp. LKC17W]|uniref:Phage tail sheath family protein n=1 Tax=Pelomonas margarita TaxID=3299031 RepID=A0ABW7FIJ1_9BURK